MQTRTSSRPTIDRRWASLLEGRLNARYEIITHSTYLLGKIKSPADESILNEFLQVRPLFCNVRDVLHGREEATFRSGEESPPV